MHTTHEEMLNVPDKNSMLKNTNKYAHQMKCKNKPSVPYSKSIVQEQNQTQYSTVPKCRVSQISTTSHVDYARIHNRCSQ